MAESRFSADAALDCWRFGQHGEGFPLHQWGKLTVYAHSANQAEVLVLAAGCG
jgi:hypothetical protein